MGYNQNPMAYQNTPALRQTLTHPFATARLSITIQVNLPQIQQNIVITSRKLSLYYYGKINNDSFLIMHIPKPQTIQLQANDQPRNPYKNN